MIDISDGLRADAEHLSAASGVRLAVDSACLPVGPGVARDAALGSGEEYELLATIPPAAYAALAADWASRFSAPLTVVGQVVARDADGGENPAGSSPNGFDHFVTRSPTR